MSPRISCLQAFRKYFYDHYYGSRALTEASLKHLLTEIFITVTLLKRQSRWKTLLPCHRPDEMENLRVEINLFNTRRMVHVNIHDRDYNQTGFM
jgi:hypothetical protein